MSSGFSGVSFDILYLVSRYLEFDDFCNLSRVCKSFNLTLGQEIICRRVAEDCIPYTAEVRLARAKTITYQEAVHRVFRRREAYATASPVSATVLGTAASFVYRKGILSYTTGRSIRILDLHNSSIEERVIDLPTLIGCRIDYESQPNYGKTKLLHYSDGVLSFLIRIVRPVRRDYLLAIDVGPESLSPGRCLVVHQLDCISNIFVRNDASNLYYGTHSSFGCQEHNEWLIRGFSLVSGSPVSCELCLNELVGADIGVTNCFEVHDGYFYALSNLTACEMDEEEEVEWVSHYHCRLFPVNRPHSGSVERMKPIWRRNHIEGPIHDSWSELRLDVDESNNRLLIVESRREWQGGNSSSQRTHYIQQLPSPTSKDGFPLTELSEDSDMDQIEQVEGESDLLQRHGLNLSTNWEMPSLSDVDWRPPRQRHVSDDAAPLVRSFLLASTKFRYYNPSCASFLDIVDDALSLGDSSSSVLIQRLRLRVGSRRQGGICRDEQGMLIPPKIDPNTGKELHGSNESWPSRGVRLWPDEDDEELSDILNPTPTLGLTDVKAASDERSVVYLAGPTKSNKRSLVMVNFDANIKLPNTRRRKGGRLEPGQSRAAKGKQKGVAETPEGRQGNDCKWSWLEPARYMSIDKGLWLR